MARAMNSNAESNRNDVANWRAYHLRVAGKKFVDRISIYEHVYLGVQGFESSAPKDSQKALMDLSAPASQAFYANLFDANYFLKNFPKFDTPDARKNQILYAYGGTNMGDGFRKAYHQILDETKKLGIQDYNKYITFISDGEPTALTLLAGASNTSTNVSNYFYYGNLEAPIREYYLDPRYSGVNYGYVYTNGLKSGYVDNDSRPSAYVNAVAKMLKDSGQFKDFFLIAIGELNIATLNNIANSLGIQERDFSTHVFKANDEMNFYMAIESISESISVEIEEVLGSELLSGVKD
jgi:uncharacterized protein YegL